MTTLVFAPNWLGDVVMALPAIADVRRHPRTTRLVVAARPSVAGVLALVPGVDGVVTLEGGTGLSAMRRLGRDVESVRGAGADAAILMPNSLHTALLAHRAGVGERWGYRRDLRRLLLTRAIPPPRGPVHQADYYRRLVEALGYPNGAREAVLEAPRDAIADARALLDAAGWSGAGVLVGVAPGAAYGGAKRWPVEQFARLCGRIATDAGATCVLLGSRADADVACAIAREAGKMADGWPHPPVLDLAGRTDLRQLAGVMAHCRAFVSNDSGAMHVAAAVGVPVVAMFGPTDDQATSPLPGAGAAGSAPHAVLTSPTWCRPCMLRECPLDHACMTGITVDAVTSAVVERLRDRL